MAFDKNKYDQHYVKDNYDRILINVKKGDKEKISEQVNKRGLKSINDYVRSLIYDDIENNCK